METYDIKMRVKCSEDDVEGPEGLRKHLAQTVADEFELWAASTLSILPSDEEERDTALYQCKDCGYEWLEYRDSSDYPNYCPHCGFELRAEPGSELENSVKVNNKLSLDIGPAFLVAEIYDAGFDEITICLETKDGGIVQDIALVRKEKDEIGRDAIECLVWADSEDDDWTDRFVIDRYIEKETT